LNIKNILNQAIFFFKNLLGFGSGHERSKRAKKNIAATLIIKGLNILVGLMLVPLTINYLNPTKYGIWITMTSLVAWFGFFDIGLGNGLRNRFAEALARGNQKLAKTYVSTTYAILIIIISAVLFLFYIVNNFLDWGIILNAGHDPLLKKELSKLALIVFTTFGMTFVLNLISVILSADQRPAKSAVFDLLGKSLSLLFIYILTRVSGSSLLSLGIVYCIITPLVLAISTFWFFNRRYKPYRPSLASVDFSKAKDLLSLGVKFFIIQIAAILLYQTNNMIISQLFGPEMVTPYNVAFKYFSILLMLFMIIIGPFWSAFTEAWKKKDVIWIAGIMKKLIKIWVLIFAVGILMLIFSSFIFKIWIRKDFVVSFSLSAITLGWVLVNAWNGMFVQFLNGVGKLKIQLYLGISVAILNIPLALLLGKSIGINGILLANFILALLQAWIYPLQYRKIITNKATGIWNN
jgi:O-antigen/teichoic acid export membrane protein